MVEEEELELDFVDDETDEERELREASEVVLNEHSQETVRKLIEVLMKACDELSGHPLRPYQIPFARRIFESLIIGDGARLTGLASRQSGKSETIANVIATAMIFLPVLAKVYPKLLRKYREGVWVGAFAPVNDQADIIFGRIVARLSSASAQALLNDPEINAKVDGRGSSVYIKFRDLDAPLQDGKGHCLVRKTTCHPKAKIEGRTYHILIIDECQDAHWQTVTKSVNPMGASVRATHIWTGTPSYTKGIFYSQIQTNKREVLKRGRRRQNHFQWDWKEVAKVVPEYRDAVYDEMRSLGPDSDEFKMSYNLWWAIDKGQFTTSSEFEELGDISVQHLEPSWHHSPVVVGIDCGKKQDRTIVTVVWVNWDRPDSAGFYEHRIINWLDLEGVDWETQYFRIYEFLQNYNIYAVGVDCGGVGDVVMSRMKALMPHINFVECLDSQGEQSKRFKYLKQLKERKKIIWPMGAKVRKLKVFRRFRAEMEDAELDYKGPNLMVYAPDAVGAHDDYVDSLAMATYMSAEQGDSNSADNTVVVYDSMFFRPSRRY